MKINNFLTNVYYAGVVFVLMLFVMNAVYAANGPPPALVITVEALERELFPITWVAGTVISRDDAKLAAEVSGKILSIAEVGTRVTKGEVIANLDDTFLAQQQIEQEAAISREQAKLRFFSEEVKRLTRLARNNNAAQRQLDEAISNRASAKSELIITKARLNQAKERLLRTKILAPFTGVVTERYMQASEWANEGDAILRLVDPITLEVQARIPQSSLPYVKQDSTVRLKKVNADLSSATVRTLVPVGDDESRLYEVRLLVSGNLWSAGQTLRVAIPTAAPRQVIAIPRDALVLRRDGIQVFRILEDNTAEAIRVKTGVANDEFIEVIGGIRAGDRVVTRGGERLRPGQKVTIISNGSKP